MSTHHHPRMASTARRWRIAVAASTAVLAIGAMAAHAGDPPAPAPTTPPAATKPAQPAGAPPAKEPTPSQPPVSDEPSLDEALGLGGAKKPADAPGKDDLERSLGEAKPRDLLGAAIDDMKRSAQLLDNKESGLPAQRAQTAAVKKLDELIAAAQRMRQQQSQSSQSSQSGQQSQQQQGSNAGKDKPKDGNDRPDGKQGEQPKPGPGGKQQQDGQRGTQQGDANANEPPSAVDPTKDLAQLDETRTEWGRLPARVREAVRQGMRDPMSAAYRKLTEEYYRRMAEDPKR